MQNSAPWSATLKVVAPVRDYSIAKHMYTNPGEVCIVKLSELGRFPCSFRCRSVWIRKLVAVRVVVWDTSGPMTTNFNCGDVIGAEART